MENFQELLFSQFEGMTLPRARQIFAAKMVERALALKEGHHQRAANHLGIHRNTLTRIMDEAGMPLDRRGGWARSRKNG